MDDAWMLGLALGLAIDAGLLLALALNPHMVRLPDDLPRLLMAGVAIAALGWTGLAPLASLVRLLIRFGLWLTREKPQDDSGTQQEAPQAPLPPDQGKDTAEEQAWRVALSRFFRAGQSANGFSGAKLSGVVGSDTWPLLVHFYEDLHILRDWGSNRGYDWDHGWGLDRVLLALSEGRLPHPAGLVPTVEVYVAPATQRRAPRNSARVVEGSAKVTE